MLSISLPLALFRYGWECCPGANCGGAKDAKFLMSWIACRTRIPERWIVIWSVLWLSGISGCCHQGRLPRHLLVSWVPRSLTTDLNPCHCDGQSFRRKGRPAGEVVAGRSHERRSVVTGRTPAPVPAHAGHEQPSLQLATADGHQPSTEKEDHSVLSTDPGGCEQISFLAVQANYKQAGKPSDGTDGGGDSTTWPGEEIDVFGDSTVKFRFHRSGTAGENFTLRSTPGTTSISNRPASIAVFSAREALRAWSPHVSQSQQNF